MDKANTHGVMEVLEVGIQSLPSQEKSYLGGRSTLPASSAASGRQMLGVVWKAGRPLPYSLTQGAHPVGRCCTFNPYTHLLSGWDASFQSLGSVFCYLHETVGATVDRKWHAKSSQYKGQPVVPQYVHTIAYVGKARPASVMTWDHLCTSRRLKRKQVGDCDSRLHKRAAGHTNHHPLSVPLFSQHFCVACYTHNCFQTEPEVDGRGGVEHRAKSGREMLANSTRAMEQIVRPMFAYTLADMLSSIDPLHFSPDKEHAPAHAAAIQHYWQHFQPVFRAKASAFVVCQHEILKGFRRHCLSHATCDRRRHASEYTTLWAAELATVGRAPAGEFKQRNGGADANPCKRWLDPWVTLESFVGGAVHNRHELVRIEETNYTRSCLRVLGALASGELTIAVHLGVPLPAAGGGSTCRALHVVRSNKDASTAFKAYPAKLTDAEHINYEGINTLLTTNRRAAFTRGIDPVPPLHLNLHGSITRAAIGVRVEFGPTVFTVGGCFIELIELAKARFVKGAITTRFGDNADPLEYASHPDGEYVASTITHERKMFSGKKTVRQVVDCILQQQDFLGVKAPTEYGWPSVPVTEELYAGCGLLDWSNETPDHWAGVDVPTIREAGRIFTADPKP